jgi:hypothetical protein
MWRTLAGSATRWAGWIGPRRWTGCANLPCSAKPAKPSPPTNTAPSTTTCDYATSPPTSRSCPSCKAGHSTTTRRHIDAYTTAGINLTTEPTVGVGSVCRRQHTGQIEHILSTLAAEGLRLHGFGLKVGGLRAGAHHLTSADSLAWSARGRRVKPPTCGSTTHASEANCLTFALNWREHVQTVIDAPKQLGLNLGGVA